MRGGGGAAAAAARKLFPARCRCLTLLLLLVFGWSCFRCDAQRLGQQEVDALRQIASKLKIGWNFSLDPCSNGTGWVDPLPSNKNIVSNLTCDCNATTHVCHVTSILLKGQNLTGVLPDDFANLTYLSILSLRGNRVSGIIPEELRNITTLQSLLLEANQLQGPIPAALGSLINLNQLQVSANNFTGELPETLGNLKNMTDFRIDGNPISGRIPSFIGNWTKLDRLDMQGTSLEGPFPLTFANLKSITQLRVSDLKGGDGNFPPLQNMTNLQRLVLRNVGISVELPHYIGEMTSLRRLDLSFNNLKGPIPSSFVGLRTIDSMYLTNNMLSGTIPSWILKSRKNLDLSYNSFTGSPTPSSCQEGTLESVNLVSSYSSTDSNSIATCLRRNITCDGKVKNNNLFINCGGNYVTIDDREYENDSSQLGPSTYETSENGKWTYSSTGEFMDNGKASHIASNVSLLNMSNPELYMTARLSPLSLRYYGLCLQKGNYSVNLHFAEIMFTNDETYASVGRRLFDVYIQGQKVLQDFDIAKEANGTGQAIIKTFTTIVDGTLEIHFRWAGKGTNSIPQNGVYGPLISAISVTPNLKNDTGDFKPDTGDNKLSVGAILGIVAASSVAIVSILILCWFFCRRKNAENNELRGLELQTSYFSLRPIRAATDNFDPANKIGNDNDGLDLM